MELWVLTKRGRKMLLGLLLQLMHCLKQVKQWAPGWRLLRKNPLQIRPQQLAEYSAAGMCCYLAEWDSQLTDICCESSILVKQNDFAENHEYNHQQDSAACQKA